MNSFINKNYLYFFHFDLLYKKRADIEARQVKTIRLFGLLSCALAMRATLWLVFLSIFSFLLYKISAVWKGRGGVTSGNGQGRYNWNKVQLIFRDYFVRNIFRSSTTFGISCLGILATIFRISAYSGKSKKDSSSSFSFSDSLFRGSPSPVRSHSSRTGKVAKMDLMTFLETVFVLPLKISVRIFEENPIRSENSFCVIPKRFIKFFSLSFIMTHFCVDKLSVLCYCKNRGLNTTSWNSILLHAFSIGSKKLPSGALCL